MKKFFRRFGFLTLLAVLALPAAAQVTNFALFKVTVYHQTNGAAPADPDFPNAYYFGAQLNLTSPNYYQAADFLWTSAPNTSPAWFANMPAVSAFNFVYGSPYYFSKAAFDADFGSGDYEMDAALSSSISTDAGFLTIPDPELYPPEPPAYSSASWTTMQWADPAKDLTVDLNSFAVEPDADEALVFINVFDPVSGSSAYYTNGVSTMLTSVFIPANTLLYGVGYRVDTFFSSRVLTPNAGFNGADGFVAFDKLTHTSLITVPPPLTIAASGTNVLVSWPSLASNFNLQTLASLLDSSGWKFATNIVQSPGLTNCAIFPATDQSRFYRLAAP